MPTITSNCTKRSVSYNMSGRDYNLISAIHSSVERRGQEPLGLEGEVAAVLADDISEMHQRGFAVPLDALSPKRRSLSTTTGAGSIQSHLAPTGSWTDILRGKAALGRLGAEFIQVSTTGQPVRFPTKTESAASGWLDEGEELTITGDVAVSPDAVPYKIVGAGCLISRTMLASVAPDVLLDYIAAELAANAACEVDHAAFVGAGGVQPVGLFDASRGVPIVSLGTNGGAPTRAALIDLMRGVHAANGDAPLTARMGWAAGVGAEAELRSVDGSSGGSGAWLWGDDDKVVGKLAVATTGIPDDFEKGSGANLSGLIYGNFRDVLVVHSPVAQLVVDPISLLGKAMVRVFVFLDVHIVVRRSASFALIKDMVTTI